MRKLVLGVLVSLLIWVPVYAQEMGVKEVRDMEGIKEAVIQDRQTGAESVVREGDVVWGWTVVGITNSVVTLEQRTSPWEAVRSQLPVSGMSTPVIQPSP